MGNLFKYLAQCLAYCSTSKTIAAMGTRSILECFYDAAALSTGKHSCFTMGLGSCGKYLQGSAPWEYHQGRTRASFRVFRSPGQKPWKKLKPTTTVKFKDRRGPWKGWLILNYKPGAFSLQLSFLLLL